MGNILGASKGVSIYKWWTTVIIVDKKKKKNTTYSIFLLSHAMFRISMEKTIKEPIGSILAVLIKHN
jgi:hypothetical protein